MSRNKQILVELGQGLSLTVGLTTISYWNTRSRPKKPKLGTFGFNLQTNNLEYWDGKHWFAALMGQ